MENSFDLIVLGAGSGGLAAAKRAAMHGAKVAVVEGDRVGGTCVVRGCVPKKLLVYGSSYRSNLNLAPSFGINFGSISFDLDQLLENVRDEVDRLSSLHLDSLEKLGIKLISGWGRFVSQNSIEVISDRSNSAPILITSKYILIAVGGRPIRPEIPGSNLGWISDDIFIQETLPEHILIVGAGFIACEFACIFRGLGIRVTQLVRGDGLLRGFDADLSKCLADSMLSNGIDLILNDSIRSLSGQLGNLNVYTDNGRNINCGAVLFAVGREPYVKELRLDAADINLENGRILVDDKQLTNIPNIFAVGDVTDRINLTPVAIAEGRALSDSLFANKPREVDHSLVPRAVFSRPEIASVGLTEEEANHIYGKDNLRIYKSKFKPMSRALVKEGDPCLMKLITNLTTSKILGCHMAGEDSAEIIQMAAIAIRMGACKEDFDKTMALHPTIAEEFVTMT